MQRTAGPYIQVSRQQAAQAHAPLHPPHLPVPADDGLPRNGPAKDPAAPHGVGVVAGGHDEPQAEAVAQPSGPSADHHRLAITGGERRVVQGLEGRLELLIGDHLRPAIPGVDDGAHYPGLRIQGEGTLQRQLSWKSASGLRLTATYPPSSEVPPRNIKAPTERSQSGFSLPTENPGPLFRKSAKHTDLAEKRFIVLSIREESRSRRHEPAGGNDEAVVGQKSDCIKLLHQ